MRKFWRGGTQRKPIRFRWQSGSQSGTTRVPGSRVPGSMVPGYGVPGSRVPGSGVPGSRVPGSGFPGSRVPGSGVSGRIKKFLKRIFIYYYDS